MKNLGLEEGGIPYVNGRSGHGGFREWVEILMEKYKNRRGFIHKDRFPELWEEITNILKGAKDLVPAPASNTAILEKAALLRRFPESTLAPAPGQCRGCSNRHRGRKIARPFH